MNIKNEDSHNKNKCCCGTKQADTTNEQIARTKVRDEKEYKDLIHRLSRIEGQVRGVKNMVEKDAYCVDILTQVAAINAALNSFNKVLLANHMRSCMCEEIRQGNDDVIEEVVALMQKMMK
ncbi:MAG: metal-sensing transcriptional repressor [Eubacteriales bacterium]|nr:metal-sensing transcriptional repressor [Eubacteriales bacterium]